MVGDKKSLLIPVEFKMAATDTSTVRKWQLVVWDSSKKPFFNISGAGEPPENIPGTAGEAPDLTRKQERNIISGYMPGTGREIWSRKNIGTLPVREGN
jgi:hypothetical protein